MMHSTIQFGPRFGCLREQSMLPEQMNHGYPSQSAAETPKKFPPVNQAGVFGAQSNRQLLGRTDVAVQPFH